MENNVADEKSFHMTPEEFRRHGHAVVDWIADYHVRIESFPVLSQVKPGEIRASLPPNPPAQGEPFDPRVHEAIEMVESDAAPDHHVLEELQPGYRIKGRLLRPAMVRVAKKVG